MKTITAFFLSAWMAAWPCYANPLSILAGSPPAASVETEIITQTQNNDYWNGDGVTWDQKLKITSEVDVTRVIIGFSVFAIGSARVGFFTSPRKGGSQIGSWSDTVSLDNTGLFEFSFSTPATLTSDVYMCVERITGSLAVRLGINGSGTLYEDNTYFYIAGSDNYTTSDMVMRVFAQ